MTLFIYVISFDADEEIIEILGSINHFPVISSLCIVTNKRRHGPFGPETGTSFSVSWDVGTFAGFYGRAGSFLDGLGFYSNKGLPTELWGSSTGGAPWSLLLDNSQKLRKITIDHKDWIFSIAFTVEDLITGSLVSSQHGGTGIPSGVEPSEVTYISLKPFSHFLVNLEREYI
ncbi:putative jacalin-like lectin domain-containing protein [Helianthus annuus]|nr:putative jacalin-like lectin domain-containing protein [Helianthus annuus]